VVRYNQIFISKQLSFMLSRAGMAVRSNGGFSEGCESGEKNGIINKELKRTHSREGRCSERTGERGRGSSPREFSVNKACKSRCLAVGI
jgi:hypothetical protein